MIGNRRVGPQGVTQAGHDLVGAHKPLNVCGMVLWQAAKKKSSAAPAADERRKGVPWSEEEHRLFLQVRPLVGLRRRLESLQLDRVLLQYHIYFLCSAPYDVLMQHTQPASHPLRLQRDDS